MNYADGGDKPDLGVGLDFYTPQANPFMRTSGTFDFESNPVGGLWQNDFRAREA